MLFRILFVFFAYVVAFPAVAQDTETPYDKEYIWGVNFNTNGGLIGGGIFRYGKHVNKNNYRIVELEIANVKHDKEFRTSSSITGNAFIYKKENYLIPIRFRYGRQYMLYAAAQEEGVRVDFLWAGGVALGIQKAYMVQYGNTDSTISIQPYNPYRSDDDILGSASFLRGLNYIKIVPALNVKGGF